MIIGIDLDDVLVPMLESYCKFMNKKYGTDVSEADFEIYVSSELFGIIQEQNISDFLKFTKTREFKEITPFPEALEGVKKLKQLAELHIVTGRRNELKEVTLSWLERHFPKTFSKVHFGNNDSDSKNSFVKLDLCKENKIDILIEDLPNYSLQVSQHIPVILLDKKWNKKAEGKNIYRVKNWKEVFDKAEELIRTLKA